MSTNGGPTDTVRVLVVDDDDEIRGVLTDLLEDEGLNVSTAGEAPDALAKLESHRPDVVLLDVVMPSMNGLDLLAEIRRKGDVPVIFVSGKGGETDRVLGLRMGADDYVV